MSKYQSKIQPEYSVHYYSKKEFESGAGYYLFETYDLNSAYSPMELKERGASNETIDELRYKGHMEVFGEPFHYSTSKLISWKNK